MHEVWEIFTVHRAGVVDRAGVAIEKDTAFFRSLQDQAFFVRHFGVVAQKLPPRRADVPRQLLDLAVPQLDCCDAATVRTDSAIDLVLDIRGDLAGALIAEATRF